MSNAPIVSKVWSFCNTLRDDGVGYGDYLERERWLHGFIRKGQAIFPELQAR